MKKLKSLGEAVRFVRSSQGLDQKDVADKSGVTVSHISRIETGQRNVSWETINAICVGLNVPLTLLVMLVERDEEFVKPIAPLAYMHLAKLNREE